LIKLSILFEDDSLLIIDKPSGIHSANLPDLTGPSIANLIAQSYPECLHASEKKEDAGLVNRLDFETSGLMIAAKTREVWQFLRSALLKEEVQKLYFALVDGKAPEKVYDEVYIGSPYRRAKKVKVYKDEPPKNRRALPAASEFQLIEYEERSNVSLVLVKVDSGKRHQIRAHARHLGFPLTGDSLYMSKRRLADLFPEESEVPAFFLHATEISLLHPVTKRKMIFAAKIPAYITKLFPQLGLTEQA